MMRVLRNPFYYGGPIKQDHQFIGRDQELSEICEAIASSASISVVSERRVGKSSLLLHLPSVQQHYGLDPACYVFAYFDFLGSPTMTPSELWSQLLLDMCRSLAAQPTLVQPTEALLKQKKIRLVDVERWLVACKDAGLHLVIAFDEFDVAAANPNFDKAFFGGLRKLTHYPLSYIIASHRPLSQLYFARPDALGSPFFNIFRRITLGGFPPPDIEMLLDNALADTTITFTAENRALLDELAGPHPFFIQMTAYYLFDAYRSGRVQHGWIDDQWVQVRLLDNAIEHFRYYWDNSELGEQLLLATLSLLEPDELATFQLYPQKSDPMLRRLHERVLVVLDQQGNPRVFSLLFAHWITETVSFVPVKEVADFKAAIDAMKAKGFQKTWLDTTERMRKGFAWIDLRAMAKWLIADKGALALLDVMTALLKLGGNK
jgi:uncharacterized protein